MRTIEELLRELVERGGSDLHLSAGSAPRIRVDGVLKPTEDEDLSPETSQDVVYSILSSDQIARFEDQLELDLSFGISGLGRFRTNVFLQRGSVAAVFRVIPYDIMALEKIGLPVALCEKVCSLPKGLVLVTGATGSGKTTTLASMLNYINLQRSGHIITIEDPIEYVHRNKKCLFNQRELGQDTRSFPKALKSVLREDPDVVMIGEMRDQETMELALILAETGHLTFATLHTSDTVQSINRIVDVFSAERQQQIRTQLSFTLQAVFCQQLLQRTAGPGRVLIAEIMIATPAVRALVRDDKIHQIYSVIQTGTQFGMRTMNQSLHEACRRGLIRMEDAMSATTDVDDLQMMFERG